jgi:SAM-dependent methyltransferase
MLLFDDSAELKKVTDSWAGRATAIEERLYKSWSNGIEGYCSVCARAVTFRMNALQANAWMDLRGEFICPVCKLPARNRLLVCALEQCIEAKASDNVLIFERITPFYSYLSKKFINIIGCEYLGADKVAGAFYDARGTNTMHQDIEKTSFPEGNFDCVIHSEVLEHVGDYKKALVDNCRILKPGGSLLFSAPIYNHINHVKCAIIDSDGTVQHLLKPAYHGNPLDECGSLVFNIFGYSLIDDVRAAGFRTATVCMHLSPFEGFVSNGNPYYSVGHMWPMIIIAKK